MVQTAYALNPDAALAGMQYDVGPNYLSTMNNPAVVLPFGQVVEKITGDEDGVKLPDNNSAAAFWGVAHKDPSETEDSYPIKSAVAVLRKGRIWMPSEEAITPDDAVFVRWNGIAQVQTLTLDIDLVSLNVMAVTVDGNVLTETYAVNHDTTMTAMAAQIQAQPSVVTATAAARVITVTSVIGVSVAVTVFTDAGCTLGATQPVITVAETTGGVAYDQRGVIRTDTDSGTAVANTGLRVIKGVSAAGLCVVEVNLP